MKKNLIGLIVLIGLSIACYFLLFQEEPLLSNRSDYKDFAIEDTASVDKIFISKDGKNVILSRRDSPVWLVNNKFPARPDATSLILKTLHDIQVVGPVSQKTMESVIKRIATRATKVEFYRDGEKSPFKTWYIGYATANGRGTYMLLQKGDTKSSKPYITHLIMERGYLGTRFFADSTLWKDRIFLKTNPREIKKVEVIHSYDTATSFRIEQIETAKFEITNLKNGIRQPLSHELAIPYFKEFESVYYEYIDEKSSKAELDSIYTSTPRHQVLIELNDGKKFELKTFNMPVAPNSMLEGKPIDYHPERMYAYSSAMEKGPSPVVQNLTFDPLVVRFEDFNISTTVEK